MNTDSASDIRALRARWNKDRGLRAAEAIKSSFKGRELALVDFPYGDIDGKHDLRGINLENAKLKHLVIENADISYADLSNTWLERIAIRQSICRKVNFSGMSDHENHFESTKFIDCDFRDSAIGYEGSNYQSCFFERCKFGKAVFIRAEYSKCVFKDCFLDGLDFNVSSFQECAFIGKLKDVWFRGQYAFEIDLKKFGKFKPNRMEHVDFSAASLSWLAFTGDVSLGKVILPNDPSVFYMNKLEEVLPLAKESISHVFEGKDLEAAKLFFHVCLQYLPIQKEQIFTLDDYAEVGTTKNFASELKRLLRDTRAQLEK